MPIHSRHRILLPAALACFVAACTMPGQNVTQPEARSTAVEPVTGVTWEWTGTTTPNREIEVSAPNHYTVRFKEDGEAQIRYGCNHGGGYYDITEGRLSFGQLTYTRIKCGEGSQSISYRQQLGAVRSFFTERGNLYLELLDDAGTMHFRRSVRGD